MPRSSDFSWFGYPNNNLWEEHRKGLSPPPRPVTLFLLGPNIFLSTLFANTLSLWSALKVRDQISHPYKVGKICNVMVV
jgi:hypothetical protein